MVGPDAAPRGTLTPRLPLPQTARGEGEEHTRDLSVRRRRGTGPPGTRNRGAGRGIYPLLLVVGGIGTIGPYILSQSQMA